MTGGIASGKSVVADFFAGFGVPIIDTDLIAREVVAPGQPALDEIRERFGDAILDESGKLDRGHLRQVVFADDNARHDLEAILHPRIGDETRRRSQEAGGPYQIIVVPLLVGSPLLRFIDRVLVVDCDTDQQLQRLLARDAESIEQARRMVAAQATREQRLEIADDVIDNDGSLEETRSRVRELHEKYLELASGPRAP